MKVRKEKKWIEKENPASADTTFLDPPRWRSLATLGGEGTPSNQDQDQGKIKVTGPRSHMPTTWSSGPKGRLPSSAVHSHLARSGCQATHGISPGNPREDWKDEPSLQETSQKCQPVPLPLPRPHTNKPQEQSLGLVRLGAVLTSRSRVKALGLVPARWAGCREGALSYLWLRGASWLLLPPRCLDSSTRLPWTALWNRRGSCDGQISAPSLRLGAHRVAQGALLCQAARPGLESQPRGPSRAQPASEAETPEGAAGAGRRPRRPASASPHWLQTPSGRAGSSLQKEACRPEQHEVFQQQHMSLGTSTAHRPSALKAETTELFI